MFIETMTAIVQKEQFISQRQKQRSAYLHAECEISTVLQGFEVRQALEYAETLIVNNVVLVEEKFATAIIIGEDTDLLILLTWKGTLKNTFYFPWFFNFSSDVNHNLLFLHAIIGCHIVEIRQDS